MTSIWLQTQPIAYEDLAFFRGVAEQTKQFWEHAPSLGQTKRAFDSQEFPNENRYVANCGFRSLSRLPSLKRALDHFCQAKGFATNSNAIVYNPMSFMPWHTNSNAPGRRHYFTYTQGEAMFRWQHPITGQTHEEIEIPGWTYRTFVISPSTHLWHTIWTAQTRLSFGFRSKLS